MLRKLDDNFSYILCKLNNVQRALSAYSKSIVADLVPLDVEASYTEKGDLALSFDDTVDEFIQPLLQTCVVQTHMQVGLSDSPFNLNDGALEEVNGGTVEEVSGTSTYKMFVKIPDRDIDMEVVDSVKNDVVKFEIQVFDERFHTISIVRCDSSNLVKFDKMLFALPSILLDCSSSNDIFAYLNELDPTRLSLSLYRFPPTQFILEFPFDPGSGMLTTLLGSIRGYSFMVPDDFTEISQMFVCHFDSTTSDQCTLDQFPYDPGANLFIGMSGGHLQVHQLHLVTPVFTLLLVMDTFQLFGSVSYICPTVEHVKSPIENEPTTSIWDPGISSMFTAVTGSTDNVEVTRLFEAIRHKCCLLAKLLVWEQLVGVEMGVEPFHVMYFDRCLWATERIGDHLVYFFMEYECGIPVKELHSYDDKVKISEFIASAIFLCKILEYQLRAVRR